MKPTLLYIILLSCLVASCKESARNTNRDVTLETFADFAQTEWTVSSHQIRMKLDSMVRNDTDELNADLHVKRYYRNQGSLLWIDRVGVDERADTVLSYLKTVEEFGFSARRFCVPEIERDLQAIRSLDFDKRRLNVNTLMARLEYRLTKAYLRYVTGQRFGYLNPTFIFNRLDSLDTNKNDSVKRPVRFRGLFDIDMDHASKDFYQQALGKITSDSLSLFLHEIQPTNAYYDDLRHCLNENPSQLSKARRALILCNMERARWRQKDEPRQHEKYVMVNIPSFHLMAIDHQDTLTMRIGCGSNETKTPLLTSQVKRMDINPKWFIPRSIIEKDIIHRVSRSYLESRNFYVLDRKTGREVDPSRVTPAMLRDPNFAVVQRGGEGNSLGRIIFRFDNNFSVYLHDTSSKGVFSQEDRGVSHGCVRVEKPFELAVFMLEDKNQKLTDKMQYSMTADSLSDKSKVIGSVAVKPPVPLYIAYYTLYPMAGKGKRPHWVEYPDVYGYDRVIYDFLKKHYL